MEMYNTEAANTHSRLFRKIKFYYDRKLWTKARVAKMVPLKVLTATEYEEIVGKPFTEG